MSIRVVCSNGHTLNVKEKYAGKTGLCPKCKAGQLSVRQGQYGTFVSCSDRSCGLIYNSDEAGKAEGGLCKKCQGPVKKTKSGSLICAVCETWQDSKGIAPAAGEARPAKPRDASCPLCRQPLRTVWTKRNKWAYRCDPCDKWLDAE